MKKVFSVLFAFLLLLVSAGSAFATGSLNDAIKKAHLTAKGAGTQLLKWQGIISADNFAPSMIVYTENGTEYPAYCLNPNKPGVDGHGAYDVGIDDAVTDPQVWGAITNGYPFKTPAELGVNSEYEAYYATKMAVWALVHDNYSDINDWAANGSNNEHVLTAMKAIYNAGKSAASIPQPAGSLSATPESNTAIPDTVDGSYLSQTFSVSPSVAYSASLGTDAPAGAKITDLQNNAKSNFGAGEKFKVLVPAAGPETGGSFNVKLTSQGGGKAIMWGQSYNEHNQDYAVVTEAIAPQGTATASYVRMPGGPDEPGEPDEPGDPGTPDNPAPTPGKLTIRKVEAGTTKGLAGAIFRVTDADGGIVGDYITDGSGQVTIVLEDLGCYYVDEIVPPAGYQLDVNNHKDIVVTAVEDALLTFADKPVPELEITKVDADTNQKLPGAVIRVAYDGGHQFFDVQTDASGKARLSNLWDGTWTVTEITAPTGYILDSTPHSVKLESGQLTTVILKNKEKPGLVIKKYDEDSGLPLGGAEFSVAKKGGSIVFEGITPKDGLIRLEGLDEGWYTVTEIAAPHGYLKTWETKDVYLEPEKVVEVKFDNRLRPSLSIMKVDSETNAPLAGAKFKVWKTEDNTVSEYVTDASGTITIHDLDEAVYSVEETEAPAGYLLEVQHKDIQLEWGKTKQLIFTNKARPSLEILKIDEETKQPLAGAKFRVWKTEDNTTSEYVTDASGRILITNLDDAIYSVEEIVAPAGYLLEAQHKDIQLEWGKTKQLIFTNKARPSLEILKIDEETKQPLAGAKFRVWKTEDNTTSEYVTDAAGRILITDLEDAIYSVEEIVAPAGYLLEAQRKEIQLEWGKTKTVIFTNKARPKLKILKIDAITGQPLANAEFRVTKVEDSTVSEYITDATGTILIENLDEGIYRAEEFMPPDGYLLYTESKEIELEWGKTKVLKFDDIRKPTLIITKTNGLTYQPIPNATFKVEYEGPSGGVITLGTYRTDENGQIILPAVNPGWFIITETIPAPGFSLPSNPVTRKYLAPGENAYTNLAANGRIGDVSGLNVQMTSGGDYVLNGHEIIDYPLNSIVIRKVHAVTGELLPGAAFEIRKVSEDVSGGSGTVIGRYTTDNSGVIVVSGLQPGGYIVTEVQAPQHFLLSENSQQQAWLKPDGTSIAEVTFANYPYGSLLVAKVDAQTGAPLANARFRVTDGSGAAAGNTSGEYRTNESGQFLISNLKPGTYVVTEIEAPANYIIDTAPQTVNIETDGQVYTVSFKNQPKGGLLITKVDAQTGAPLANARFKVTDGSGAAAGNTNGEYTTNASGEVFIPNLKPGAYVVTEIEAPANYIIDTTPQTVNVTADGQVYKVSFKNQPKGGLLITKVDAQTNAPLANARFKVVDGSGAAAGNANGEYTTNASGEVFIPNLKPGAYAVTELEAPANYVIDTTPQTVNVTADGQTYKVSFKNQPYGSLLISKVDTLTNKPLANARFKVVDSAGTAAGNANGEYTTNANGEILVPNLSPGAYVVTELAAPPFYMIDTTPQTVNVNADGQTYKLSFKNQPFGTLVIKKLDFVTKEPLSGAEFKVTTSSGDVVGGMNGMYVTDASGTIEIPNLPKDTYVVEEIKAPTGYILENQSKTIAVDYGKSYTLDFYNKPKSGLQIIKIDSETKDPLKDARFTVYKKNGEVLGDYVTDKDGLVIIDNLEAGWYKIVETKAPAGYQIDETAKDVEAKYNQFIKVTFENKKLTSLVIKKTDDKTGEPLGGAVFRVEKQNGLYVGEYTTGKDGLINLPTLDPDWYIIRETKAPDGFLLDETPKTVEVKTVTPTVVTFTNKKLTALQIRKVDEQSGEPLGGAVFAVEKQDGGRVGEYTTDNTGFISIPTLDPDWYVVRETKAPAGYLLDETPQSVEVKTTAPTVVTFTNKKLTALEIIKTDEQTGEPLNGAVFVVEKQNGERVGEYTTNERGIISIPNLAPDWYIVKETKAPQGYILSESPKTVEVKTFTPTTVKFTNQKQSGMQIIKTDAATGTPLSGAIFTVYKKSGDIIGEFSTDANGVIIIDNLAPGWYKVAETRAPQGYLISESPKDVEVIHDQFLRVTFADEKLTALQIRKVDEQSGEPLGGAMFAVEKQNGERVGEYTTDNTGFINIPTLDPDWYVVCETKAPAGYVLDETPQSVEVKTTAPTVVTFTNKKLTALEIIKTDEQTGEPLNGAVFVVEKQNGERIGEFTTNERGIISIPNLAPDWYVVKETKAPQGYILSESPKTVEVKTFTPTTVKFTNQKQSGMQIIKTDAATGTPLSGAVFTVYKKSGDIIGEFSTDAGGVVIIDNLAPGWYKVAETRAPQGYLISESPKDVEVTHDQFLRVTFADEKLAALQIKKIDAVTGAPLAGAEFTVTKQNGERVGDIYITDASGFASVPSLAPDYYVVTEVKAPAGYLLDSLPQTVQVKTTEPSTVTFSDKAVAGIQIVKTNSVTKGGIPGVQFTVTKLNGEKVGAYTTGKDGTVLVPNLEPGEYTVTETAAANGYILDSEPRVVTVEWGKNTRVEVENTPASGLLIIKTDANTGKPLAGVKFDVRRYDGSFVNGSIIDQNQPNTPYNSPNHSTTANGDITGNYATDANGRILINDLPAGRYMVIETAALPGYEIDTDVHDVTVVPGQQSTLQLTNRQKAGIRILKIDSVTKAPIYNVEFVLFDANGNVVGSYYTDNNGVVDIAGALTPGRYTIRETRPAPGYYPDDQPKTVTFESGKYTEITWTNVPEMGQLQLLKKSGDDNEINGLPAGTPLEGAVFEIYAYKSGNLIDRFVSGSDGKAVSKPLPLGRYIVKEVQAPQWYKVSDKQLDIDVEFATQIIKQEFLNYSANTGVAIKKTGNYEAMPGDVIKYDIKEVRNTGTVPLTDFFWRDVLPADAARLTRIVTGTYNQSLKYKILATTNKGDSIIITDNLSTTVNNVVDCSNASLGLRSDEYVTSFTLVFGTVKAGFAQVEAPQVYAKVLPNLPNGYQFANKADIGGKYQGEWVISNSTWPTTTFSAPGGKLPRTGY